MLKLLSNNYTGCFIKITNEYYRKIETSKKDAYLEANTVSSLILFSCEQVFD